MLFRSRFVTPRAAGEGFEKGKKRFLGELQFFGRVKVQRVKRRDKRCVGVYPYEISYPAFGDKSGNLVGGVTVGVDKNPAVALSDMVNEKIHEQGGFPHSAHTEDVQVAGSVYGKLLLG